MGMYGRSVADSVINTGPGKTQQQFAGETDINKIIAGFEKTGMVKHLNEKEPFYGDVSELVGYHECLNKVHEAQAVFMGMDARVRERFKNDPNEMIEFLDDPRNLKEAVALGMVVERPEVVPGAPVTPVVEVSSEPSN